MKPLFAALIAVFLFLVACGPQVATPTATPAPTSTPIPTATPVPTNTPIPTVALPTLTPTPTVDPDEAFLSWLTAEGYEFLVNVNDGSVRYQKPGEDETQVVDIYPDGVLVWDLAFDSDDMVNFFHSAGDISVALIEAHGQDAEPIRSALASPHDYPLVLQLPGYVFLLEVEPAQLFSSVRMRVTFFD